MSRQPFHRSDFTGSVGPGLARLRAANIAADRTHRLAKKDPQGGLEVLKTMMRNGEWNAAILIAARWSDLGDQAEAIQRGREAIMRPAFQRQLKRDPEALIEAAKAALLERWPL